MGWGPCWGVLPKRQSPELRLSEFGISEIVLMHTQGAKVPKGQHFNGLMCWL